MSHTPTLFDDGDHRAAGAPASDDELERVAAELRRLDPNGQRVAKVIRETFDQLLDGQRTGRWDYRDLRKTEKTHMGTLVEINLHREFEFDDGIDMDYRICGTEVDCKFSQSPRGWQIPIEASGHLCLLLWASDQLGLCSGGLIRISDDLLGAGSNRDRKRTLNKDGVGRIRNLWQGTPLPENLLLQLDAPTRGAILSPTGRFGQRRTDQLFRRVQNRLISRTTVLTVAQQDDPPKRVRDARLHLRPEGIVILGHQGDHPRIARALSLPVPRKGEWVSARITPMAPGQDVPHVPIQGTEYRIALLNDPPRLAPLLDSRHEER